MKKCPNCKEDWKYWAGVRRHGECIYCGFVYNERKQGTPEEQAEKYKKIAKREK